MDYNERFGQIEALLADLLRRMDRQGEQIGDIINILKISDERQTRAEERQNRAEERQDAILTEMKRGFAEADRRFNEYNEQLKQQNEAIKAQGQRIDAQGQRIDTMLNTQMQMLELMSRQANKTSELEQRVPTIIAFETRMRRLEDAVFNKGS